MSGEIKTCPKCEALPKIIPYFFGEYGAHDVRYYAKCPICKNITFSYSTPELAVLEWNKNCEARRRRMDMPPENDFRNLTFTAKTDSVENIGDILHITGRDQTAKADKGKAQIHYVPPQIILDIAEVREYGVAKYQDPENWKRVEIERYIDAIGRHYIAMLYDPLSVDEESGLAHYKHIACNVAFLCELLKEAER